MAKKKTMTKNELKSLVNSLSMTDLLEVIDDYGKTNSIDVKNIREELVVDDLQSKLLEAGINKTCPHCNSSIVVKNGTKRYIQRFKCKDCGKIFTLFTNTIMEKTKFHWDIWVQMVQLVLLNTSTEDIQTIFEDDYNLKGINSKTIDFWRHKIIHVLAQMPMPKLSGIIQIDETFFRESQKGSRHLISLIKGEKRKARYGIQPSKYGVMGNEFATVVCMVDNNGYVVAKVSGMGKLGIETFVDLFDDYIENVAYICADGNHIYKEYSYLKQIPLYVKPSGYVDTLRKAGIYPLDPTSPTYKTDYERQQNMYKKLYYAKSIDYIHNMQLSYEDFKQIKTSNGLNLSRVNQFHNELKRTLVKNMRNVSTKYLPDWIGYMVYVRNWTVKNGKSPSSMEDAENILIEILKSRINYTIEDFRNTKLDIPMSSDKYMALLKQRTEAARKATGNRYFKYDEEDNVVSFDKRKFLENLPEYKLNQLRKHYRIPAKWVNYAVITELLKKKDIWEQILILINDYKTNKISEEDLKYIQSLAFRS